MNKNERGITLIALLITIIVLIILAAVSIKVVTDMNIIKMATEATEDYAKDQVDEKKYLEELEELIDSAINGLNTGNNQVQVTPNGNANYAKEHSVKLIASEGTRSIKYQWVKKGERPVESDFVEVNSDETITKNGISGEWYVSFLIEDQNGEKKIENTKEFYFDNNNPTVTLTTAPVSDKVFTLTAKANDNETKNLKYQFFVNGNSEKELNSEEELVTCTVEGETTMNKPCYVIVTDEAGNTAREDVNANTQLHTWEKWNIRRVYTMSSTLKKSGTYYFSKSYDVYKRDSVSGSQWELNLVNANVNWQDLNQYIGCFTISDDKTEVLHMANLVNANPTNKCICVNVYSSSTFKTEESKGTQRLGFVNAVTFGAYPNEKICGSFYYIYAGLK